MSHRDGSHRFGIAADRAARRFALHLAHMDPDGKQEYLDYAKSLTDDNHDRIIASLNR